MEPATIGALITGWCTLVAALIKVGWDGHVTRKQIQNSHKTNYRNDFEDLKDDVREVKSEVRQFRIDLRTADLDSQREHERIWDEIRRNNPKG